ncbi:MAG: hypothetical protein AAF892_01165 [Cyanobacteria bacterium P01_D01_bin.71]
MTVTALMPRKRRTFKFDERLLDGLKVAAQKDNSSANNWLETLLMKELLHRGILPENFEPLVETRGGDRTSGDDE